VFEPDTRICPFTLILGFRKIMAIGSCGWTLLMADPCGIGWTLLMADPCGIGWTLLMADPEGWMSLMDSMGGAASTATPFLGFIKLLAFRDMNESTLNVQKQPLTFSLIGP
jgi:hypothetical protein